MGYFLEFDPHSFFQVVKKLFLEQEPFEYINSQASFIEMYRDQVVGLEPCLSHGQIVSCFDASVARLLEADREKSKDASLSPKGEALQNAFIFFVSSVSNNS